MPSKTSSVKPLAVLVVDDDAAIRRTVKLVLQTEGCSVELAANGVEALQHLRGRFRGLLLMDVMMPDLDGWATVRAIRDEGLLDDNLICMLTALDTPDAGQDALAECIFDYLAKPFDAPQLLAIVRLARSQLAV